MESYLRAVPVGVGPSEEPPMGLASRDLGGDPAEAVARIAADRRGRLLRVYRRRLRWASRNLLLSRRWSKRPRRAPARARARRGSERRRLVTGARGGAGFRLAGGVREHRVRRSF